MLKAQNRKFTAISGHSIGFLITTVAMLKGSSVGIQPRLGIIANALGIAGGFYFRFPDPSMSVLLVPCLVFYGVWLIAAGRRLYKLGKQ